MDPTSPGNESGDSVQSESDTQEQQHSPAVQARFNEITAEKKALELLAKQQQEQITALMRMNHTPVQQVPVPQEETLPEGIDPGLAKFFKQLVSSEVSKVAEQTQQLFHQVQSRVDQNDVNNQYGYLPEEVRKEANRIYSIMRQKYPDANMEDAIDKAIGMQQRQALATGGQRQQFNTLPQGARVQGMPPGNRQQTALIPPTQREDWDRLDWREQVRLTDEYVKKGGKLVG